MKRFTLLLFLLLTFLPAGAVEDNKFCGLGLGLIKDSYMGNCIVTKVVKNSPAGLAGLQIGDRLKKIDNFSTYNFWVGVSQEKIMSELQGEPGTKVTLTYKDINNNKQVKTLERSCFIIPPKQNIKKTKEQLEFEKYWYQIAPPELEGFEPFHPLVEKHISRYYFDTELPGYFNAKKALSYWEGREKQFRIGYNTCFDYLPSEKNGCLQNLINREILKTQHAENLQVQSSLIYAVRTLTYY